MGVWGWVGVGGKRSGAGCGCVGGLYHMDHKDYTYPDRGEGRGQGP